MPQSDTLDDNSGVATFFDVVTDQARSVGGDSSPRSLGSRAFREAWFQAFPAPEHYPAYAFAFSPKAQKEKIIQQLIP